MLLLGALHPVGAPVHQAALPVAPGREPPSVYAVVHQPVQGRLGPLLAQALVVALGRARVGVRLDVDHQLGVLPHGSQYLGQLHRGVRTDVVAVEIEIDRLQVQPAAKVVGGTRVQPLQRQGHLAMIDSKRVGRARKIRINLTVPAGHGNALTAHIAVHSRTDHTLFRVISEHALRAAQVRHTHGRQLDAVKPVRRKGDRDPQNRAEHPRFAQDVPEGLTLA